MEVMLVTPHHLQTGNILMGEGLVLPLSRRCKVGCFDCEQDSGGLWAILLDQEKCLKPGDPARKNDFCVTMLALDLSSTFPPNPTSQGRRGEDSVYGALGPKR